MRTDRASAPPPPWELACWRLAMARDRVLRRSTGWVSRVPGALWLRRQLRRVALLLWWTATLQFPDMPRGGSGRAGQAATGAIDGCADCRTDQPCIPSVRSQSDAGRKHHHTSYGKVDHTLRCLASIAAWPPDTAVEIIVIHDASNDPELVHLELVRGIRLMINSTNLGYLRSCNVAAQMARGEFVLLLNNDTQVTPGWLDSLVALLGRPAGCRRRRIDADLSGRAPARGRRYIWNDGRAGISDATTTQRSRRTTTCGRWITVRRPR